MNVRNKSIFLSSISSHATIFLFLATGAVSILRAEFAQADFFSDGVIASICDDSQGKSSMGELMDLYEASVTQLALHSG